VLCYASRNVRSHRRAAGFACRIASASLTALALAILSRGVIASPAGADDTIAALRRSAFDAAYNLDYPEAVRLFDLALARDPDDSATHRARAVVTWLHIVFMRGSVTVDQYMGGMTPKDVTLEKPPPDDAATFQQHAGKALALAEARLRSHPQDVQALYDVGAALGVLASYTATVEGRVGGAFSQARRAFNAHESVMRLDARRKDAGLVVGTYRYVVSTLPFPLRWMAYVAGFGGDREYGLRLIEEAARYPSDTQFDARVALLLLYNREGRFKDALAVTDDLMARYPRNRIVVLEAGATAIRARLFAQADRVLSDGLARFAADTRPKAFGEEATWYYKRGVARIPLGNVAGAQADLQRARSLPARSWVKARIRLEQGKLEDLAGRRERALAAHREALGSGEASNDPSTSREARRLLKTPYR
jgi:tetratricopeptide (TPR) repeat protein